MRRRPPSHPRPRRSVPRWLGFASIGMSRRAAVRGWFGGLSSQRPYFYYASTQAAHSELAAGFEQFGYRFFRAGFRINPEQRFGAGGAQEKPAFCGVGFGF